MNDLAEQVNADPDFSRRYELGPRLGEGGMGTVRRGTHRLLGRPVAVKFMRPEFLLEEVPRQRFLSEARTAAGLIHPNVCVVLDFGFAGKVPFLVTELVEGQSLQNLTLKSQPAGLPPALTISIARQLLDGLEAIHALGIVHRDLKPANVVITQENRVKILDFGLAKPYNPQSDVGGATLPGTVVGTPAYISPEQATAGTLAPSSDLYALTVMLYEIVVGHLPFRAENAQDVIKMHVYDAPTMPDRLLSAARHVLERGLTKRPSDRYQGADEMRKDLDALEAALEGGRGFLGDEPTARVEPPTQPGLPAKIAGQTLPRAPAVPVPPPPPPPAAPLSRPPAGDRTMTALAEKPRRPWPFLEVCVGALVLAVGVWVTSGRPDVPVGASPSPTGSPEPRTWYARMLPLRGAAQRGELAGFNAGMASLRRFMPDLPPGGTEARDLDDLLLSLLDIACRTTEPATSPPAADPDYERVIVHAGRLIRAGTSSPLIDLLDRRHRPPLHPGSALDWLRALAMLDSPRGPRSLADAHALLVECSEVRSGHALGAWSAEALAALHEAAEDDRGASTWRARVTARAAEWAALASFQRRTLFHVKTLMGKNGRPGYATPELRRALKIP